jgi:organic hydroperoxide reductase OsmC/OhrA
MLLVNPSLPALRIQPSVATAPDTIRKTCHMLWYLHLAAVAGVVVTAYVDSAVGTMLERANDGRFTEVVLQPLVTISADSDPVRAASVHEDAHHACFIANSVNFPVRCEPRIVIESV